MTEWSLPGLLTQLHSDVQASLAKARTLGHPTAKGDASEAVWINLLNEYLPRRYRAEKAFVVDSKGAFSQQIDVLIFDRQYTPFVFTFNDQLVVPAEAVYAAFEAKQSMSAANVAYAQEKAASVRALYRSSAPIHTRGKAEEPRDLFPILAGILTLDADWKPPFGDPLRKALDAAKELGLLDLGCVAMTGFFQLDEDKVYRFAETDKAATAFLLELIARLQALGTVPAIDIRAYAAWLA
jgi:hypothetical protein